MLDKIKELLGMKKKESDKEESEEEKKVKERLRSLGYMD